MDCLPLELIGLIVNKVAAGDDRNLSSTKACSLVCQSMLPFCRNHIFASVTVDSRQMPSPTTNDLDHLLSNSPYLAVNIRKLVYHVDQTRILFARTSLSSLFKKLERLQTLAICHSIFLPGRKLDWMSTRPRRVLLPLLHLPTLTSISLFAIQNFPLADLVGCVNLKKLQIKFLECSTDVGEFPDTLPTTPLALEQLTIQGKNVDSVQQLCHARRPDGQPIIDFLSLKRIVAGVAQLDSLKELFGICRSLVEIDISVQHIETFHPSSTSKLKGLFDMLRPSLPTLIDIRLENHIRTAQGHKDPFYGLCHELEKMVGQNKVEMIKLVIWIELGCDCTRGDEWGSLDNVLMRSPEDWPALREVSLSIIVVKEDPMDDNDLENALRKMSETQFTKLMESERVQYTFTVDGVLS